MFLNVSYEEATNLAHGIETVRQITMKISMEMETKTKTEIETKTEKEMDVTAVEMKIDAAFFPRQSPLQLP